MINFLFRVSLHFISISLFLSIYFINQKICFVNKFYEEFIVIEPYASYFIYLLIPFLLTSIALLIKKWLAKEVYDSNSITKVENADDNFLPNYLSYIFVALGVTDFISFVIIFFILLVFTWYLQKSYFNPLLLIFGYSFYYVTNDKGKRALFICKNPIVKGNKIKKIRRINDNIFISLEKKHG